MTAFGWVLVGVLVGMIASAVLVIVIEPGPGFRWRPAGITTNERGLRMAPPILGAFHGERVDVRESSLADDMCLWLYATAPIDRNKPLLTEQVAVELPVSAASELADALAWLARNHYQRSYK